MTKVSYCGCIINGKHELTKLFHYLYLHNPGDNWELSVTVDDRTEDGTYEAALCLKNEHPDKVQIIRHTHEDSVEWLEWMMDLYDRHGIFHEQWRSHMKKNLALYKDKKLFNHNDTFLWLSSGRLYNKAVENSTGNIVVVTPLDFIPLYTFDSLIEKCMVFGTSFYAKLHAIFARVTNLDLEWLKSHVEEVRGGNHRSGYRWDSDELFIDYLRYPSALEDYNLPDFHTGEIYNLADPDLMSKLPAFCARCINVEGSQWLPDFHGVHVMTRDIFQKIGGFTEEWYGRALADDKMTFNGSRFRKGYLPYSMSFAWIYPGEILPDRGPGYKDWKEVLRKNFPHHERHPIPPFGPVYLHSGLDLPGEFHQIVNDTFNPHSPPVRMP